MATLTPVQGIQRNDVVFSETSYQPKVAVPKPVKANEVLINNPELQTPYDFNTTQKAKGGVVDVNPIAEHTEPEEADFFTKLAVGSGMTGYMRIINAAIEDPYAADPNFNSQEKLASVEKSGYYNLNRKQREMLMRTESEAEFNKRLADVDGQMIDAQITDQMSLPMQLVTGAADPLNYIGVGTGNRAMRIAQGVVAGTVAGNAVYESTGDVNTAVNLGLGIGLGFGLSRIRTKTGSMLVNAAEGSFKQIDDASAKGVTDEVAAPVLSRADKPHVRLVDGKPRVRLSANSVPYTKLDGIESSFTPAGKTPPKADVHIDTPNGTYSIKQTPAKDTSPEGLYAKTTGIFQDKIKRFFSSADELRHWAGFATSPEHKELLADGLLHNFRNADNVINNASVLARAGERAIATMDKELVSVAREFYGATANPFNQRVNLGALKNAEQDLQLTLLRLQEREEMARIAGLNFNHQQAIKELAPNQGIAEAVQKYMDTNFAKQHLDHAKRNGMRGSDTVAESSLYTPLRWSWDKMQRAMVEGRVTREALAEAFGAQLYYRYGDELAARLALGQDMEIKKRVRELGFAYLETQERLARSSRTHGIAGTSQEELMELLMHRGMSEKDADRVAEQLSGRNIDSGKSMNMKNRNRWQFDQMHSDGKGGQMSLLDYVDTNMVQHLETYNRSMAHRSALAAKGITSESQLREVFDDVARNLTDPKEVKRLMDSVDGHVNALMGRAIGEDVPNWVKNGQALASAFHLRNSGLYNTMDLVTTTQQLGIVNTMRGVAKTLRGVSPMDKDVAASVMRIMGENVESTGYWRNMITHLEDNHVFGDDLLTYNIQQAAQTVRFVNMSEYIRRANIRIIEGVYTDIIERTIRGSKVDAKAAKRMGLTDDLLAKVKAAGSLDKLDSATMFELERAFMTTTDDLAMYAKHGEAPAFLEQSTVGKHIFPYMRYALITNQKLLRGTYHRDGGVGVGMLLAYQIPMAMLLAQARLVTSGKEPNMFQEDGDVNPEFLQTALNTMTGTGYFGVALGTAMQGGFNSSSTALAPLTNMGRFVDTVTSDEEKSLHDYTKNVPVLGVSVLNMGIGYLQYLENED